MDSSAGAPANASGSISPNPAAASSGRHSRQVSGRSEGSAAGGGRPIRPKSPRVPEGSQANTGTATPAISNISFAQLVNALIATKRQLGLNNLEEVVAVMSSALRSAGMPAGATRTMDTTSINSDFLVGDYPLVRGILGETLVHRSVKEGKWDLVRRWIRRSRENAMAAREEPLAGAAGNDGNDEEELWDKDAVVGLVAESLEAVTGSSAAVQGLGISSADSRTLFPGEPASVGSHSRRTSANKYGVVGSPKPAASKVNDWLEKSGGINARTIVGTTPLHEACSMIPHFSNDEAPSPTTASAVNTVTNLLEEGADPCLRDLFGLTPLHRACIAGNTEVIRLLLEKTPPAVAKQQLAITDNHGNTPLHVASYHDHADAVRLLLESGADLNARDEEGGTALHDACEVGAANAVRVLLERGRSVTETGPDGVKRRMLDTNARNFKNRTALHVATTPEVAELLLNVGAAKLHATDVDGFTPFHRAAARGLVHLVRFFLSVPGVKPDARTKPQRRTSLHLACAHGSGFFKNIDCSVPLTWNTGGREAVQNPMIVVDFPAVIELLVQAGARPDAHTHPHRNTPVHVCCSFRPSPPLDRDLEREQREWLDVLRLLLRSGQPEGTDPDVGDPTRPNRYVGYRNCYGDTPLHYAVVPEVAELLLSYGADMEVQNWNGETPVDTARRGGKHKVEQFLLSRGSHLTVPTPALTPVVAKVPTKVVPAMVVTPKPAATSPKAAGKVPPPVPIRPTAPLPPRPRAGDLLRKSSLSTSKVQQQQQNSSGEEKEKDKEPVQKKVNFADEQAKESGGESGPEYDPAVRFGD